MSAFFYEVSFISWNALEFFAGNMWALGTIYKIPSADLYSDYRKIDCKAVVSCSPVVTVMILYTVTR